jgi:beta-glucosidase
MATMSLPAHGSQDRLISAVSAVNDNVIVINNTGVAINMPWLDRVSAVLQAWFPGQEAGNSIVDVLFGTVNPSGKLPMTIPRSLADTPSFGNFPGDVEKLQVHYEEGIYIGYRYYDKYPEKVLFPFGFGLSYSEFKIGGMKLQQTSLKQGSSITVQADVENTGSVAGSEVVQVYIAPPKSSVDRPLKVLAGFAKVTLEPGQSKTVEIEVSFDSAAYWDENSSLWMVEKGEYEILVGNSSANIVAKGRFSVNEDVTFKP